MLTSGWKHDENEWKQNLFSWWQAERWKFMYSAFCCLCCLALRLPYWNPLICFLFVAVILSSVPSSCQSCLDWFCHFCKEKKRCKSGNPLFNQLWLLWEGLAGGRRGGGDDVRSVSSPVLVLCPWGMLHRCNSFLWASELVPASNMRMQEKKRQLEWLCLFMCVSISWDQYLCILDASILSCPSSKSHFENDHLGMFFWNL